MGTKKADLAGQQYAKNNLNKTTISKKPIPERTIREG